VIAEVATDLLGEIVEIYEWGGSGERANYSLRGRGHVRAVYVADKNLMVLVEHDLSYESATYGDRTKDGGFEIYSLNQGRARVVQRCARCCSWDQKKLLFQSGSLPDEDAWDHKQGEGCKKVGHGG